ncbi:MAG: HPr family phosphocarrier protein [Clostridiaceae bacterium]|nr:HPr family phosphocarrier protein [Eubacteriales bacterium]
MKEINYVITDAMGLHARPAGQLVKAAMGFKSDIQLGTPAKMANAKRIMGVMGLALKQGENLIITVNGDDEEAACKALNEFLKANL